MKKVIIPLICGLSAMALSCQKNESRVQESANLTTFSCEIVAPSDIATTKVSVSDDGKAQWEVGDEILIHGKLTAEMITHTLTAGEISADGKTATFSEDLSGVTAYDPDGYYVAYPASAVNYGSSDRAYYYAQFNDTNKPLLAGYKSGNKFIMYNLCGVLSFKVSGDFDEFIFTGNNDETLGYDSYQVKINSEEQNYARTVTGAKKSISGAVTGDGSTVHRIYFPNGVNLTQGFTIKFKKSGSIVQTVSTKSSYSVEIARGKILPLGDVTSHLKAYVPPTNHDATNPVITGAEDLGASGTANSYIVDGSVASNAGKVFKFKAYKGNGTAGVGTVASVEVLWATYNSATAPSATSDVIANVDFDKQDANEYYEICFQMPDPVVPGNAVIAAKDESDNILWSWHIWIPETTITTGTYGISTPEMMDRNLGALTVAASTGAVSAKAQGLMYQWGRKDPFVGTGTAGVRGFAAVAGTAKSTTTTAITMDYAHAHPTVFAGTGADWISVSDSDLWGSSTGDKTQNDPCPPGYKVPLKADATALFAGDVTGAAGWSYDEANYRFTIGSPVAVFPHMGYINNDGSYSRATRSVLWRAQSASAEYIYEGPGFSSGVKNSCGASVRCVAE